MDHNFLHRFRLTVEGFPEPFAFEMFYENDITAEATDAVSKFIARQEDNFLPLGLTAAVRANKVVYVKHEGVERAPA